MSERNAPGPLASLRVVELASEYAAYAGKLLADLGAEVVLVEPPGGAPMRGYEPFVDDRPDPERSLWWWHYQTSKLGVTLDLSDLDDTERLRRMIADADIVLEAEEPGRLAGLGLDDAELRAANPALIWVSVTPFGPSGPRVGEQVTDLTILASGGPVWSCGYDDHALPPVRGGGNQAYQTASMHAANSALIAVLHRDVTGRGQRIDVSMHAAANVTTEAASYEWLVARDTVQRQTCRHAAVHRTGGTMGRDPDGRYVPTGVPPRAAREFRILLDWLDDLGLRDEFPEAFFLEMAIERGGVQLSELADDVEAREMFAAGRDALVFIANRLSAYEFFVQGQRRGLALSIIYAPEEVMTDPHFVARGFPVEVRHDDVDRSVTYPGAPFLMERSPWRISRPAPRLGEHNDAVLGPLVEGASP